MAQQPKTGRPKGAPETNPFKALYALLTDPGFAITIIIVLAVASILGIVLVDQVPFRGEQARMRFTEALDHPGGQMPPPQGRPSAPLLWMMIHIFPERPFSCLAYRTLLALLSLALMACVIKRWRRTWRLAFQLPAPEGGNFTGDQAFIWRTQSEPHPEAIAAFFRRRLFRWRPGGDASIRCFSGSRFAFSRLGAILTHIGFLLLVIGGLWMASAGRSSTVYLGPGDSVQIPGTDALLELRDFRIERTPRGEVSDYISVVRVRRDTTTVRVTEIEVNKPLRYQGHSFYQTTFRANPLLVSSLNVIFDQPRTPITAPHDAAAPEEPMGMSPHGRDQAPYVNPVTVTVLPGERTPLPATPYEIEIETFLADFRMGPDGPFLGSSEARNPAVRINFFAADSLLGRRWYFLLHPEMAIGSGPDLKMRMATFEPLMQTGLQMATHPGSGWVWAGLAVMTLGTLLSFLLRHERIWLRVAPAGNQWELSLLHLGALGQDPARVAPAWQAAITPLMARFMATRAPIAGEPHQVPRESGALRREKGMGES